METLLNLIQGPCSPLCGQHQHDSVDSRPASDCSAVAEAQIEMSRCRAASEQVKEETRPLRFTARDTIRDEPKGFKAICSWQIDRAGVPQVVRVTIPARDDLLLSSSSTE